MFAFFLFCCFDCRSWKFCSSCSICFFAMACPTSTTNFVWK